MKTKTLTLMSAMIFSVVLLLSFATAIVDFTDVTNNVSTVSQGDSVAITFKLKESGYADLTSMVFNTPITFTSGSNTFTSASTVTNAVTSLSNGATSVEMTLTVNVPSGQALGTYDSSLILNGTYSSDVSYTLPLAITVNETPVQNFCEYSGVNSNLALSLDFSTEEGFGDDEEWFPLDKIKVEIEVENNGDEKIKDIVVEWGLYDLTDKKFIIDDEENDFDLKDGDEETLEIEFTLDDPEDYDADHDYVFYVWVTGEDEELDGNKTCVSESESIEIVIESDFVILGEFEINGKKLNDLTLDDSVLCGSTLTLKAEAWNIGDDDQEDVYVVVYNKDLDIFETITIGDVDALENEKLEISIELPSDAEEKWYALEFKVYDEDNDIYENDFDDDESVFNVLFKIEGACKVDAEASVSALLDSEAVAGKELILKLTITNPTSQTLTFDLAATGYEDWASSVSLDQNTIVLSAGTSQEVLLSLDTSRTAEGAQSLNFEVSSDGELVMSQALTVTIEESIFGFSLDSFGENWHLWLIGALNIVLILIIIIVAVKVSKK